MRITSPSSRSQWHTSKIRLSLLSPSIRKRSSSFEFSSSKNWIAYSPKNTDCASSKVTPCLNLLINPFLGSHSNLIICTVYVRLCRSQALLKRVVMFANSQTSWLNRSYRGDLKPEPLFVRYVVGNKIPSYRAGSMAFQNDVRE